MSTSPSSFDREVREIYRERNTRPTFDQPRPHSYLWFAPWLWLVVVVLTSAIVALVVASQVMTVGVALPRLLVERSTPVGDAELSGVARRLASSSVVVFAQSTVPTKPGSSFSPYLVEKALGHGLVLSSDGWLVTTREVVPDATKQYLVATADGSLREVRLAVADPIAPLVYLKVEASNLTATSFARSTELAAGQIVVTLAVVAQGTERQLAERRLASRLVVPLAPTSTALNQRSEDLPDRYLLDSSLPDSFRGAPVAGVDGKVIGLVGGVAQRGLTTVYPLEVLAVVIDDLFKSQRVVRPLLGVRYLPLDSLRPYLVGSSLPAGGALLTSDGGKPAVATGSPAATARLRDGDVITQVAGERILSGVSLSFLLQQYRPGTKLNLVVWREGKEQEVEVTLGELSSAVSASDNKK